MKQRWYGHVLASRTITHVGPDMHIFNGSESTVYVEVAATGELWIKPPKSGQLVVQFGQGESSG